MAATVVEFNVLEYGIIGEQLCHEKKEKEQILAQTVGLTFAADDEDDELSGEIGIGFFESGEMQAEQSLPASAQFLLDEDGTAMLLRWPRTTQLAIIPSEVKGHVVTRIGPLAFAPMQLDNSASWEGLFTSPVSFSIFCMKNMRYMNYSQEGYGPKKIELPESVVEVGRFAFWDCTQLEDIKLSSGIRLLGAGVFGGCTALKNIVLPDALEQIGEFPPSTCQVMPDIGTFAGCTKLQQLTIPASTCRIGAHAFNSSGLKTLTIEDSGGSEWKRSIVVHTTAFDHTAALCWLEKSLPGKGIIWRIGLPPSKDKILRSDPQYGYICDLPRRFLVSTPKEIDQLALCSGRLDFEGRMAIARLEYPALLSPETGKAYLDVLATHYASLPLFWPDSEDPWREAFVLMSESEYFSAEHLNLLLRQAGELYLPPDLIGAMIEERNRRFKVITGFEDLEL